MLEQSTRFVGLLCVGLAAGVALCVLLAERAWGAGPDTGQFYTQFMQLMIRALTVPGPALGGLALVAMSIDAVLLFKRGEGAAFWLGVAAVSLSLVAMALTRFGHFPINDQVLKWNPVSPPADWQTVQAKWSALHVGRTISAVGSFALFLLGNLVRK
jgi:uncharacterized membrane protein